MQENNGLKIGKVQLSGRTVLAPMAGYGDMAMRRLCREFGASLTVTEMVSCKGLLYKNKKTEELLQIAEGETPSCVQLFGAEPEVFSEVIAHSPHVRKFDIIDINMGCPVPKVTKCGEGSALMLDLDNLKKVVRAAVKAAGDIPVTVKMRLGWDDAHINVVDAALIAEGEGAAAVAVHGRTTAQLYRGTADWEQIFKVKEKLTVPLIGNGDVKTSTQIEYRLSQGVDGVMVGRGALGHPDIFSGDTVHDNALAINLALRQTRQCRAYYGDRYTVVSMRKHLIYYLKGIPDNRPVLKELYGIDDCDELLARMELLARATT